MNIEAILKELEDTAAEVPRVKADSVAQYQRTIQNTLLRGVAAIKTLQGRVLIQQAEALFYSLPPDPSKKPGTAS